MPHWFHEGCLASWPLPQAVFEALHTERGHLSEYGRDSLYANPAAPAHVIDWLLSRLRDAPLDEDLLDNEFFHFELMDDAAIRHEGVENALRETLGEAAMANPAITDDQILAAVGSRLEAFAANPDRVGTAVSWLSLIGYWRGLDRLRPEHFEWLERIDVDSLPNFVEALHLSSQTTRCRLIENARVGSQLFHAATAVTYEPDCLDVAFNRYSEARYSDGGIFHEYLSGIHAHPGWTQSQFDSLQRLIPGSVTSIFPAPGNRVWRQQRSDRFMWFRGDNIADTLMRPVDPATVTGDDLRTLVQFAYEDRSIIGRAVSVRLAGNPALSEVDSSGIEKAISSVRAGSVRDDRGLRYPELYERVAERLGDDDPDIENARWVRFAVLTAGHSADKRVDYLELATNPSHQDPATGA